MGRSPHIAIAGAGIAGLTAALALARRGIPATVFEQADVLQEIGAGLQISPNAWRVLDALGLADPLTAASTAPGAVRIRSGHGGGTVARMPLGNAAEKRWGAPYRVVHRADLQAILADAANKAGAELRLGARITGVQWDRTQVRITAESKSAAEFDGLVGADGLWSAVRRLVLHDSPPRLSGKVAWRTTLPADAAPEGIELEETGLWLGRDSHLVHYGVRGGRELNVIAVTTDSWRAEGWSAPGDPAEITAAFAAWPAMARALVAAPDSWGRWALADRPPDRRWGDGPVTLAGDAAHPMLPFLAQGAAMGIEDAWVLAANLTDAVDVAAAFRR
jgi:salicylate hydroxylase